MSDAAPNGSFENSPSTFDSRDCIIMVSDEPGDRTVRLPRPLLERIARAERERLLRWSDSTPSDIVDG
jgi:hypothetical protein